MTMSTMAWGVMIGSIIGLWGVGLLVLYRTLHDEERKLELIREQGKIDTYSPTALSELETWIENHPNDQYVEGAKRRYNDCVETLREIDEPFYDWSDEQVENLEKL